MAVAAPWLDQQGATSSFFTAKRAQFADHLAWYYAAAGFLLVGGAMGWYLVRRVYLPVKALTQQAQAALRGEPQQAIYSSAETQNYRRHITFKRNHNGRFGNTDQET